MSPALQSRCLTTGLPGESRGLTQTKGRRRLRCTPNCIQRVTSDKPLTLTEPGVVITGTSPPGRGQCSVRGGGVGGGSCQGLVSPCAQTRAWHSKGLRAHGVPAAGRGLWVRVRGGRGLQTKAAQFLPCGNTSGWSLPAPLGGLSALAPSALLSGLATTRQVYPALPLRPPSHSPARPQPSGWPLRSPQCGGDSLTL